MRIHSNTISGAYLLVMTMTVLLSFLLPACNKKTTCGAEEKRTAGRVTEIKGPDTLKAGKEAPLLLLVPLGENMCVYRIEGKILASKGNYVQLGAEIVYADAQKSTGCDCDIKKEGYAIVYFTPTDAGNYVFGTQTPPDSVNHLGFDSTSIVVTVP